MGTDKADPKLIAYPCSCGGANCQTIFIGVINPIIEEADAGLAYLAPFPAEHAQEFINKLREFAAAVGVRVT